MKYGVSLNNGQCLFDSSAFDTVSACLEWAKGRGRNYSILISDCEGMPIEHYSINRDGKLMRSVGRSEWEEAENTPSDCFMFQYGDLNAEGYVYTEYMDFSVSFSDKNGTYWLYKPIKHPEYIKYDEHKGWIFKNGKDLPWA